MIFIDIKYIYKSKFRGALGQIFLKPKTGTGPGK
jgi:hypothetical protein